jgi:hypothetical protein
MNFRRSGITFAVFAGAVVIAGAAYSQEKSAASGSHGILHPSDLKWTPIIKGCDTAAVNGDPSAEGAPFVLRLRCAAGTRHESR